MITLTPEEASEYENGGKLAAINAFRRRTHLGLVESKMAVEQWLRDGKPVALNGQASLENAALSKLSEALTRARVAEDALAQMKMKVHRIVAQVAQMAEEFPEEGDQDIWYQACGRMSNKLSEGLGAKES